MPSNNLQRVLSFLLAFTMIISLFPCAVAVVEAESTDESIYNSILTNDALPDNTIDDTSKSSLFQELKEALEQYVTQYGIHADMTDAQLADSYIALDSEAAYSAWTEAWVLDERTTILSEEDQFLLAQDPNATTIGRFVSIIEELSTPQTLANATFEDYIYVNGDGNASGNGWTASATSKQIVLWISRGEISITVKNNSESDATISFNWVADGATELTIGSETHNGETTGYYSGKITAGSSISINAKAAEIKNAKVTFTMENFGYAPDKDSSEITVLYSSTSLGTVTKAGDTTAISDGDSFDIVEDTVLTATPSGSAVFLGWVDANNKVIKLREKTYTAACSGDQTIKAIFADTTPWFLVDGLYLIEGLAESLNGKTSGTVTLMNNATLPAGIYTVPSGVTLHIPFNDANTLHTTEPGRDLTQDSVFGVITYDPNTLKKPSAYRTLTMADGAHIIINGAMSLSGNQCSHQNANGCPTGALSFVNMASGSSITVNSDAFLYAWGYITGSGTITAKDGATIFEDFQVLDWRGGQAASSMVSNAGTKRVFPLSQYFVQNIEVPLSYEHGAKELGYMSVVASKVFQGVPIQFIGEGGLFVPGEGATMTKRYLASSDQLQIEINGNLTMSALNISVGDVTMKSADYVLPITNNLLVNINSGTTTISQDMALLPGAQINIASGANLTLDTDANFYVYDIDEWGGKGYVYSKKDHSKLSYISTCNAPTGRPTLDDAKIEINGTLDANAGFVYVTNGGANIYSTSVGKFITTAGIGTTTYQATQEGTDISFVEIPITPAKLKNADGSFVATASGGTNTYTYSNGRWCCETHDWGEEGDRICDICGLIKIYGTSVKAGDALDIFFYVEPEDFPNYESGDYTAKIFRTKLAMDSSKKYTVNDPQEEDIPSSQWVSNQDHLRFCYDGIAAKEMTDIVTVKIVDSTGKQVSQTITESIEGYATRALQKLENTNDLHTTLVDMLNYGALAQQYFGYRADNLANANLTDEQKALATQSVSYEDTTEYNKNAAYPLVAASVTAGNYLYMTFYFTNITDLSGFTAEISYTDHYGSVKGSLDNPIIINGSNFDGPRETEDGRTVYGPVVKNLAIADGRQDITCVLKKDGTIIDTVTSSVESYVTATIENNPNDAVLIELCKNLLKFTDSAHRYFHPGT